MCVLKCSPRFLDEMSAYAQPTRLIFLTVKNTDNIDTVPSSAWVVRRQTFYLKTIVKT